MKTLRIYVYGLVQGISFRAFVKEHAENLGVFGYVRNLEDNRIEIVLEGYENEVNKMLDFCKKGPNNSHITDFEIEKIPNQGFSEFKIITF